MTKSICDKIEELILDSKINSLSEKELNQIKLHISECKTCAEFSDSLERIEESLKTGSLPDLTPDPKFQPQLRERLLQKHHKTPLIKIFSDKIKSLLQYRIPVYQIGIAVIIVFIIINLTITKSKIQTESDMRISQTINSPYLNNNIGSLDDFNVGFNATEDSLLINFTFISM